MDARPLRVAAGRGRLHYVVLRPSLEATLRRAQGRRSVDALTSEEPVRHMWNQFAQLGDYERFAIDTGNSTVAETVSMVTAAVVSGSHRLDLP